MLDAERQKLVDCAAEANALDLDPAGWAALASIPLAVLHCALNDPEFTAACDAANTRATVNGASLGPRARRTALRLLDAIDAQVQSGVNGFEAVELMKPIVRMIEHHDRVRLAERDHYDNLPMVNVYIGADLLRTTITPAVPAQVVDAQVRTVEALVPPVEPHTTTFEVNPIEALCLDMEPITDGGQP